MRPPLVSLFFPNEFQFGQKFSVFQTGNWISVFVYKSAYSLSKIVHRMVDITLIAYIFISQDAPCHLSRFVSTGFVRPSSTVNKSTRKVRK